MDRYRFASVSFIMYSILQFSKSAMDVEPSLYYISIDELEIVFKTLPANPESRLQFISLPVALLSENGGLHKYRLEFDWNSSCNDWEMRQGQPIVITVNNRLAGI